MALPKQVNIGDMVFKISYTDIADTATESFMGMTDFFTNTIKINTQKLCVPNVKMTLLHEILHCIFYSAGEINHDEKVIEGIAQGIYRFLKHNKLDWFYE